MRQQSGIEGPLTVLSVSPLDADYLSLEAIIGPSTSSVLFKARDFRSAQALLQEHDIAVVVCERDLLPGTWMDMLEHIKAMPNAPSLIVASRLADDHLWAEALNLGAWDVLATPFDRSEVIRSVKSGWQRWHDQNHLRTKAVKVAATSYM
jgi:DNA-binding NtrC family response regulator